jgi:SAM-dependent methyltransferase
LTLTSSPPDRCPVCAGLLAPVLEVTDVPVFCNVLWPTREQALAAPVGDIRLAFCGRCGMLRNAAFDPELVRYSPGYENSLHFSPAFRRFAEQLARRLIERYDLHGKQVVDVGCGRGDFLALLCDGTGNRGVGYDPSYPGTTNGGNPSFVRGFYAGEGADFICCRHVLEHVEAPRELLDSLAPDATVYFELPDGGYMLRETAIWDLIYEHPNYFTAHALRRLFEDAGYGVLDLDSSFGGQYLYVEAVRGAGRAANGSAAEIAPLADAFGRAHDAKVAAWSTRLGELVGAGRSVAVWGAGSKGVTFLNTVAGGQRVRHVIDLNPRKHGRFVPGTGQQITAPESLAGGGVDLVLAMNRLYEDEIRRALDDLGVAAEVVSV